ncbi:MAG TPA: GDP-mannose 4,6-dehydratase, partial [Phycicoccus sp.]|nr:GDP-mannose 4,6-dehydratase [Phycicoccus sp.]
VEDFVRAAFAHVGIDKWRAHVTIDPALFRPADPAVLVGNASKARAAIGWRPSVDFEGIVARMVDHDRELLRRP